MYLWWLSVWAGRGMRPPRGRLTSRHMAHVSGRRETLLSPHPPAGLLQRGTDTLDLRAAAGHTSL